MQVADQGRHESAWALLLHKHLLELRHRVEDESTNTSTLDILVEALSHFVAFEIVTRKGNDSEVAGRLQGAKRHSPGNRQHPQLLGAVGQTDDKRGLVEPGALRGELD